MLFCPEHFAITGSGSAVHRKAGKDFRHVGITFRAAMRATDRHTERIQRNAGIKLFGAMTATESNGFLLLGVLRFLHGVALYIGQEMLNAAARIPKKNRMQA